MPVSVCTCVSAYVYAKTSSPPDLKIPQVMEGLVSLTSCGYQGSTIKVNNVRKSAFDRSFHLSNQLFLWLWKEGHYVLMIYMSLLNTENFCTHPFVGQYLSFFYKAMYYVLGITSQIQFTVFWFGNCSLMDVTEPSGKL